MDELLLVLTNMPNAQNAQALAQRLVQLNLAACVNLIPGVHSVYRWQGVVEVADEVTMMIKTTRARYAEVELEIKTKHPYQLPEIIALPIVAGLPEYLGWVANETKKDVNV